MQLVIFDAVKKEILIKIADDEDVDGETDRADEHGCGVWPQTHRQRLSVGASARAPFMITPLDAGPLTAETACEGFRESFGLKEPLQFDAFPNFCNVVHFRILAATAARSTHPAL